MVTCRDCAVPYDVWPGVCPCGASEPALPPALEPAAGVDVAEGSAVEPVVVEGPAVVVAAGPTEPKPRRVRRRQV